MGKHLVYLIISMLLISAVFAVTSTVSSFYGQSNPFNITLMNKTNTTLFLDMPFFYFNKNISIVFSAGNISGIFYQFPDNASNITLTDANISTFVNYKPNSIVETRSYVNYYNYPFPIKISGVTLAGYYDANSPAHSFFLWGSNDNFITKTLLIDRPHWLFNQGYGGDTNKTFINLNNEVYTSYMFNFSAKAGGTAANEVFYDYYVYSDFINNNYTIYFLGQKLDKSYSSSIIFNSSLLNDNLQARCSSGYCTDFNTFVRFNMTIYSLSEGYMQINLSNATYSYGIDNCSNSYNIPSNATSYQFQIIDTSKTLTNVNTTSYLNYLSTSFFTENSLLNTFKYCIYPSWFNNTGNILLEYIYGSTLYTYVTENSIFDNTTEYINLTIETTSTDITATVYDETGTELEGAYIYPQRYDPTTGNYVSMGQFITNFEGQSKLPLTLNTVRYRFLLYYPASTLLETTNPTYIYATTISFYLQTSEDILEDYWKSESISSQLSYLNSTRTFTHTYLDVDNDVEQGCLTIFLLGNYENQTYSRSCTTGSSGTINLVVVNTTNAVYLAKSSVYLNGNEIPLDSLSVYFSSTDAVNIIGFMGLLATVLLTIAVSFIFFFSIPLAIIMIPLPTVMLSTIGFININPAIAWGIEVAALVLAIIINKRS